MTEQKQEDKRTSRIDMSSKFWRTFLVILAAVLVFVGPTYGVYAMDSVLNRLAPHGPERNYFLSMGSGFASFVIGLVIIWYLIRNKVLS